MLPDVFRRIPIAHRGLHDLGEGRPENSRSAILAAIDAGYGIEIDLQLSSDDEPIAFHDYSLERLTDQNGAVRQRSRAELVEIALKGGKGETLPTLRDVLDLVAGRVALLIELKDQDGAMGDKIGALEAATIAALEGYVGPVALMSFNPHTVARLAELAPNLPRGLITSGFDPESWTTLPNTRCDALREIPDFERCNADFISHEAGDLTRPRVQELRNAGVPVLTWTIKTPEQEADVRSFVDNVTFEGYRAEIPG